jgi:nucleoside-diphosphate-sugar epimerase
MRVLVTGAAGFVGYAVAALLVVHGHKVIGLTRSPTSALAEEVPQPRLSPDQVDRVILDLIGAFADTRAAHAGLPALPVPVGCRCG